MGMYNEVYKSCPKCSSSCTMQIPQVVLGFGNFNLDRPKNITEELDTEQRSELASYVNGNRFFCEGCHEHFQVVVELQEVDTVKVIL